MLFMGACHMIMIYYALSIYSLYTPFSTSFMVAERAAFTGFDPYTLTGVRVTDQELGHGSCATVLELE